MIWWRPAHEMRGTRRCWFTDTALMSIEMSEFAAKTIYRRFNLMPESAWADNDRDRVRW